MKSIKSMEINPNYCDMKLVRKCKELLDGGWDGCCIENPIRYWDFDRNTKVDYIGLIAGYVEYRGMWDQETRNLVVYAYNLLYNKDFVIHVYDETNTKRGKYSL